MVPQGCHIRPCTFRFSCISWNILSFENISLNIKHQRCSGSKLGSCESLWSVFQTFPALGLTLGQVGSDHEASERSGALGRSYPFKFQMFSNIIKHKTNDLEVVRFFGFRCSSCSFVNFLNKTFKVLLIIHENMDSFSAKKMAKVPAKSREASDPAKCEALQMALSCISKRSKCCLQVGENLRVWRHCVKAFWLKIIENLTLMVGNSSLRNATSGVFKAAVEWSYSPMITVWLQLIPLTLSISKLPISYLCASFVCQEFITMHSKCLQWNPCRTVKKQDTIKRPSQIYMCFSSLVQKKNQQLFLRRDACTPTRQVKFLDRKTTVIPTPGEGSRLSFAHVLAVSWDDVSEKVVGCLQICLLNSQYIAKPWITQLFGIVLVTSLKV